MTLVPPWVTRAALGAAPLVVLLLVVGVLARQVGGAAVQDKATSFFISVIFVVGLQMFSGNSGLLSFGHLAFAGIGAYVSSLLTLDTAVKSGFVGMPEVVASAHLPFLPAVVVAVLVTAAIAVPCGVFVLRLGGNAAFLGMFVLLVVATTIFTAWNKVTRGPLGLYGMPAETTIWLALAVACGVVVLARLLRDSSTGLQLRASREDEVAAAASAVRVRSVRMRAWILSAAVSGLGGALLAHHLTAISPDTFFLAPTFTVVMMLILGGMTTVSGAVMGAAVVTAVLEVVRPAEKTSLHIGPVDLERLSGLGQLSLAAVILLTLYVRRQGLVGRRELDEYLEELDAEQGPHPNPQQGEA